MNITIIPYTEEDAPLWDDFCANAVNAGFLHTRLFLSYHGARFKDVSALVMASGKLVGLFPAAESLTDSRLIISHPGITYGGILHQGRLGGMRMIEALTALTIFYKKYGYTCLHYKAIPYLYTCIPSQDDLYALFRLGAQRIRCDLSSTIDLTNRQPLSKRRKRGLNKARKSVELSSDPALLGELWSVVAKNLASRYGAEPVHTLAELTLLKERFPENIFIRCALMEGRVEAGIILFNSYTTWHTQYIAASKKAYAVSALDAVFAATITDAQKAGIRYFDFGTSNEDSGKILNDGLYRFKSEFGGGGVAHEQYELRLD